VVYIIPSERFDTRGWATLYAHPEPVRRSDSQVDVVLVIHRLYDDYVADERKDKNVKNVDDRFSDWATKIHSNATNRKRLRLLRKTRSGDSSVSSLAGINWAERASSVTSELASS
jgi:hypothetical protein